jgi:signal transduction histidine kinase
MELIFSTALEDRKKTLVRLQWLIVLAASYLLLFKKGEIVLDPLVHALVLVLILTIVILNRLPEHAFQHRFFNSALISVDTVLISAAIALNRDSPWDLFLAYFFGLFIAATGESLIKIVTGCLLISVVSVVISASVTGNIDVFDSDLVFRIPFLFGVSILYGYLAEQAKREKDKALKAEETEKLKRQLVSALAHDIKNPLGVIMGYAETIGAKLSNDGHRDPEGLDAVERIQDNAERIVKLVTGFLEASKVEQGGIGMTPRPIQINKLLREAGQQQMGLLRRKEISLNMDLANDLPEVEGDETQVDRVLWNLIGNAVKYTPRGGTVTLKTRLQNGKVAVSVSDTGPGISKEELPLLFSEFCRLKGSGKIEGTGLGLFIVKTIVEAHGGRVQVESDQGLGSTFTVDFPAAA